MDFSYYFMFLISNNYFQLNSCMNFLCCAVLCLVAQSCPTLCHPRDCSPPDSSVHGNLQARTEEWVAMPSSRGSSQPRDWTHISYVSCIGKWVLCHLGSPQQQLGTYKSEGETFHLHQLNLVLLKEEERGGGWSYVLGLEPPNWAVGNFTESK